MSNRVTAVVLVLLLTGGGLLALATLPGSPLTPHPLGQVPDPLGTRSDAGLTTDGVLNPPPITGKVDRDSDFVMAVIPGLASYTPLTDGTVIFGNILQIYIFAPVENSGNIPVNYVQFLTRAGPNNSTIDYDNQYVNTSVTLAPGGIVEVDLNLPSSTVQMDFTLNVNGAVWHGYQLTPVTLLPVGTFTIGGLDLLILIIVAETVILTAPLILVARWMTHKARYAPHFALVLWGHVVLIGAAGLLFFDYQQLDAAFGGLSYFVYPVIVALLLFLWSLHLFNTAEIVEILKPDTMSGHRLRFLRWTQLTATMKDGRTVLIDPRWRGFFYALLGHYTTLIPAESDASKYGEPAPADIQNRQILTEAETKKELARKLPSKQFPEDDFRILNAEKFDEPVRLWWVDSRDPVDVKFPRMSVHKWVEVPAKVDKHGEVVTEAHREEKLTWPHILEPESSIRLAGVHYYNTPVAALGWSRAEDDFALLEKRAFQVVLLKSRLHSEAERMTEERLAEFISLMEGSVLPMNEAETLDETERRPTIRDGHGNWWDSNEAREDMGSRDRKPRPSSGLR